jgi:hypothetical protein
MTKPNVQQAGFGMVNIAQLSSTLGSIVSLQDQALTALKTLVRVAQACHNCKAHLVYCKTAVPASFASFAELL